MPTVPISTFVLWESIATLPCCFGSYLAQPIFRYLSSLSTDICRKRTHVEPTSYELLAMIGSTVRPCSTAAMTRDHDGLLLDANVRIWL